MTTFDLWDVESGNVIGSFDTKREALGIVQDLLDENGLDYVDALDLGCVDDDGNTVSVAGGPALLNLVSSLPPGSGRIAVAGGVRP